MEITFIILFIIALVALSIPLGKYISNVFSGNKQKSDFIFNPLERVIYKLTNINPDEDLDWRENLKAFISLNLVWFVWGMLVLLTQTVHPFWNPEGKEGLEAFLAFNTVISFVTNTNLQHYSGEVSLSYFSQLLFICFLQFVSAGIGIASVIVIFKAIKNKSSNKTGNIYFYFVRACVRVLLPLSVLVAITLLLNGTPSTFQGSEEVITIQGDTVQVATGPVAPVVAIKQLGTNGGGYFGINSSHPFENPNAWSNIAENFSILIIPMAMVFAFGFFCNMKKTAIMIFSVMMIGYVGLLAPTVYYEGTGNPLISEMGVTQPQGNMEGKEVRFGGEMGALWGVSTTSTSNGSVNSMHDSFMPLSGMFLLLGMIVNAFFGGVGVGMINMYIYLVLTVFICGLMVGRTPEIFGKKIEMREIKLMVIVLILHPFLILTGTAIAAFTVANNPDIGWLNNPSYHGFSEMLYEFTSAAANNGSGFEGLGDNTNFWNITTGFAMFFGRYIPILLPIAIAGYLSEKKFIPESGGTLKTDTALFGITLLIIIITVSALTFAPALISGPVAEFLSNFK